MPLLKLSLAITFNHKNTNYASVFAILLPNNTITHIFHWCQRPQNHPTTVDFLKKSQSPKKNNFLLEVRPVFSFLHYYCQILQKLPKSLKNVIYFLSYLLMLISLWISAIPNRVCQCFEGRGIESNERNNKIYQSKLFKFTANSLTNHNSYCQLLTVSVLLTQSNLQFTEPSN